MPRGGVCKRGVEIESGQPDRYRPRTVILTPAGYARSDLSSREDGCCRAPPVLAAAAPGWSTFPAIIFIEGPDAHGPDDDVRCWLQPRMRRVIRPVTLSHCDVSAIAVHCTHWTPVS